MSGDNALFPLDGKTVIITAAGDTIIWTPGFGKHIRFFGYIITLPGNAIRAVAGELTIKWKNAIDLPYQHVLYVPSVSAAVFGGYTTGQVWVHAAHGYRFDVNESAVLNLSAALTGPGFNVCMWGREED